MIVRQTISKDDQFDAVVIGGGPGGSQCALWLKLLGYKPSIVEQRSNLGGLQNESPYINTWIAVSQGFTGQETAKNIQANISSHDIPLYLNSTVTHVESVENGFRVHFENNQKLSHTLFASNLVIASGVKPASGGLQPTNNLLIGPGKQIANYTFTDKNVAILGGGDSAFENYEFIKQKNPNLVHIYARHDDKHTLKVRREFLERIPPRDVYCYEGPLNIDTENNIINKTKYDTIVTLFGWTANLPSLSFDIKLDEKGFVKTHPDTAESSQPGVYAIGEIAHRAHPCCTTAMADGVVAAKAIQYKSESLQRQLFFSSFNKIKNNAQPSISCETANEFKC